MVAVRAAPGGRDGVTGTFSRGRREERFGPVIAQMIATIQSGHTIAEIHPKTAISRARG